MAQSLEQLEPFSLVFTRNVNVRRASSRPDGRWVAAAIPTATDKPLSCTCVRVTGNRVIWPACRNHRRPPASGEPLSDELLLDVLDRHSMIAPKACQLVFHRFTTTPKRLNPVVRRCTEPNFRKRTLPGRSSPWRSSSAKRALTGPVSSFEQEG